MSAEKRGLPASTFTGWDPTPEERARGYSGPAMTERCPTCDRETCRRFKLGSAADIFQLADCEANRVDWRARALEPLEPEVQRQRDGASYAEAIRVLRAERDRLRAFVETVSLLSCTGPRSAFCDIVDEAQRVLRGAKP